MLVVVVDDLLHLCIALAIMLHNKRTKLIECKETPLLVHQACVQLQWLLL